MADPMLEFGRKILGDQPFSVQLGTEFESFSAGKAVLSIRVKLHCA